MADQIEGRVREIIEAPNAAHVAIARADGSIQTVVVWADVEDGNIVLNSAVGRAWPANLERAGTATVTVLADGSSAEWVSVEGRVVNVTTDGADEHIDLLAKKYLGLDSYPYRVPGEQRIKFTLTPTRVYHLSQG
jgi:PPOX class probable F420-dependent enzyme